jgi:hypothetical protein
MRAEKSVVSVGGDLKEWDSGFSCNNCSLSQRQRDHALLDSSSQRGRVRSEDSYSIVKKVTSALVIEFSIILNRPVRNNDEKGTEIPARVFYQCDSRAVRDTSDRACPMEFTNLGRGRVARFHG